MRRDILDVRDWAVEMVDVCEVGHIVHTIDGGRMHTECDEEFSEVDHAGDGQPRAVCFECLSRVAQRARRNAEAP
jgi:hypothetical protein